MTLDGSPQPANKARYDELASQLGNWMKQNKHLVQPPPEMLTPTMQYNQQLVVLTDPTTNILGKSRFLIPLPTLTVNFMLPPVALEAGWKSMLRTSLVHHGLYCHIEEDVPPPDDETELEMWKKDRKDVVALMLASIPMGSGLFSRMLCLGWTPQDDNPKEVYQKILDALGFLYEPELQLVLDFKRLEHKEDDNELAEGYFHKLEALYKHVMTHYLYVQFDPKRRAYFLGGARTCYPEVCDRYTSSKRAKLFLWKSFFRDVTHHAMLHRFRDHPARIRSMVATGVMRTPDGSRIPLGVTLPSIWLDPKAGREFLGGKGFFEIWESVIEDAGKKEKGKKAEEKGETAQEKEDKVLEKDEKGEEDEKVQGEDEEMQD